MFGLGPREYVALGGLAVAGLLAFLFFDPTSTEGDNKTPGTISLGEPVPPTATPTATPEPVYQVVQPKGQWFVTYYEQGINGDVKSAEGFVDALDFDIADRPFLDFKPDAWSMKVSNTIEVQAGHNRFTLDIDGLTKVWVDDALVVEVPNGNDARKTTVSFDRKAAGKVSILIEVRDTGGPVRLRWLP